MKRTGRVSYKTILIFQEYLIDNCLNGDMRIGQAIYNYMAWCDNNNQDPHGLEENQWINHFSCYINRGKIDPNDFITLEELVKEVKQDTAKSDERTE